MLCRTFKNNNFTIRRDDLDAPADTLAGLVCAISDDIDAPDVAADVPDAVDAQAWGNGYGVYYVAFNVNGAPRDYAVTPDDLDAYNAGRTVRLVCEGLHPRFVMPTHYHAYPLEWNGARGTLYKLCDPLDDGDRAAIERAGCIVWQVCAQYAPELHHDAVFVPNGTCFSFC